MARIRLTNAETTNIDVTVAHYEANRDRFVPIASALVAFLRANPVLNEQMHFIKYRLKDPPSLRKKLVKKAIERRSAIVEKKKRIPAAITPDNLFTSINDLAGVRILYLHTEQFAKIHPAILAVFDEQSYRLIEPPTANCWDGEYEAFYKDMDLRIDKKKTESMYSSVHYVVEVNRKTKFSCEVQVRSLSDELWGEVSHRVNYPEDSPSRVCRNQLKTLARFTTGCTRLVDGIFQMDADARKEKAEKAKARKKKS